MNKTQLKSLLRMSRENLAEVEQILARVKALPMGTPYRADKERAALDLKWEIKGNIKRLEQELAQARD